MKSHVKYLCLAMALCLALGFASVANASLPDVGDHWAKAGIEKWVDSGLAKGYPDGTFKPDNNITRAEFVALMNRAFDVPKDGAAISFADVKAADWYYADVCAAANGGYVKGYEDNTFRPNNAITRAEAAAIVARLLELPAGDLGALDKFSDAASIADWAKGSVAAMVEANLLSGYPDGTFGAAKLITRAESIVTLDRAVDYAGIEIPEIVDVSVEGVSLNLTSLSLKVGDTSQLKATVKPENASVKTVSWESSNDKVATVDGSGKVIAVATGSATITVTTKEGGKTASCSVSVTQYSSGGGGGSTPTKSVSVSLADTASGIGKVATITVKGYPEATHYQLAKDGVGDLTGKVNIGDTEVVLFLKEGDSVNVKLYKADGTLLATLSVTVGGGSVTPPTGSVKVSLADTASGIGKVATVAVTGYAGATHYQLAKDGVGDLTGKVNIGDTEVVLFLNDGDSVKVKLYKADGTLLDTVTVTAGSGTPVTPPTGTVEVSLANTASGIGKVATVTVTGYEGATQYMLEKDGIGDLTGKVNIGETEVVLFLNNGDSVKVKLYKADGALLDTVTVTAQ